MVSIVEAIADKPRISNQACAAFEKFAENCQPAPGELSNCLSPYYREIVQTLVSNTNRDDWYGTGTDLRSASYTCVTTLIQCSGSDQEKLTEELMMPVLQQLE